MWPSLSFHSTVPPTGARPDPNSESPWLHSLLRWPRSQMRCPLSQGSFVCWRGTRHIRQCGRHPPIPARQNPASEKVPCSCGVLQVGRQSTSDGCLESKNPALVTEPVMRPFATDTDASFTRVRLRLASTKSVCTSPSSGSLSRPAPSAGPLPAGTRMPGIELDCVISRLRNFVFMAKGRLDWSAANERKLSGVYLSSPSWGRRRACRSLDPDVREAKAANHGRFVPVEVSVRWIRAPVTACRKAASLPEQYCHCL